MLDRDGGVGALDQVVLVALAECARAAGKNTALIQRTGKVPVLLAGADHDGIMPGAANALELSAWQEHCHCDVAQFVLRNTGHAFMAHTSLTRWTSNVITWLRRHHLR